MMDAAPEDPLDVINAWLREASERSRHRNPLAMALATATGSGRPSLRMVLLKRFCVAQGYFVFYSHYGSRKGQELRGNPRAAAAMYWEEFGGRQLRVEGPIVKSPPEESDRYFATRPVGSQINAWVSEQSAAVDGYDELQRRSTNKAAELGISASTLDSHHPHEAVGRPASWGGYRLWFDDIELWIEGQGRFHRRFHYSRNLEAVDALDFTAGPWRSEYLQP